MRSKLPGWLQALGGALLSVAGWMVSPFVGVAVAGVGCVVAGYVTEVSHGSRNPPPS